MTDGHQLSVATARSMLASANGDELISLVDALGSDPRPGVKSAVTSAERRIQAQRTEESRLDGLYQLESELAAAGPTIVAGVDEVGRGALAGPLTAGACVLPLSPRIVGLDDSKRLSPARRNEIALRVRDVAVCWSVAHVEAADVDRMGVTEALKTAMRNAVAGLTLPPNHVVVDGIPLGLFTHETAVVGGDRLVAAIAAASVLAKVERDELMTSLATEHPEYGFEVNKGYGTLGHLDAIARFGRSAVHRTSFCPGKGMDSLFPYQSE